MSNEESEQYYKTTITLTFSHKGKIPTSYAMDQILEAAQTEVSVDAWTECTLPCTKEEAAALDPMDFQPLPPPYDEQPITG
jgi:hypothetical protein